jgi:hypothetical protein
VIVPRLLSMVHQFGFDSLNGHVPVSKALFENNGDTVLPMPTNGQALRNMLIVIFRYLVNRIVYQNKRKWFVAFKQKEDPVPDALKNYTSLIPPKDRFWADPFVIRRDDKAFIYVEEFLYSTNKGHIALLELDKDGKLLHTEKILEKAYHMSYPFLFEYEHKLYMIPETHDNKTIELYQCEEFPGKWRFVMNLMENVAAMDTTLFYYRHKWWLFTAINESINFPDYAELYLFYSGNLFTTKWHPHPNNPIVSDIRNARPAGRIFMHENKIYRPSQDCSGNYGRAFNINQVITLSETSYDEMIIATAEPDWEPGLKGTHTLNFDDDFAVIDAFRVEKRIHF